MHCLKGTKKIEVMDKMVAGEEVTLTREPSNRYDQKAVVVSYAGTKLGYLPEAENIAVASLMDQGYEVKARLKSVDPHTDSWKAIELVVVLET